MHTTAIHRSHPVVLKATRGTIASIRGIMRACADPRGADVVREEMRVDSRFSGMREDRWDGGMGGTWGEMLSRRVPG